MKENQFFSNASNMDTNSDSDVSVKLDTSEPHVPRTKKDSVTAVLAVQKLVTRNQSLTKLKHLSMSHKNNFLRVLLDSFIVTSCSTKRNH